MLRSIEAQRLSPGGGGAGTAPYQELHRRKPKLGGVLTGDLCWKAGDVSRHRTERSCRTAGGRREVSQKTSVTSPQGWWYRSGEAVAEYFYCQTFERGARVRRNRESWGGMLDGRMGKSRACPACTGNGRGQAWGAGGELQIENCNNCKWQYWTRKKGNERLRNCRRISVEDASVVGRKDKEIQGDVMTR